MGHRFRGIIPSRTSSNPNSSSMFTSVLSPTRCDLSPGRRWCLLPQVTGRSMRTSQTDYLDRIASSILRRIIMCDPYSCPISAALRSILIRRNCGEHNQDEQSEPPLLCSTHVLLQPLHRVNNLARPVLTSQSISDCIGLWIKPDVHHWGWSPLLRTAPQSIGVGAD